MQGAPIHSYFQRRMSPKFPEVKAPTEVIIIYFRYFPSCGHFCTGFRPHGELYFHKWPLQIMALIMNRNGTIFISRPICSVRCSLEVGLSLNRDEHLLDIMNSLNLINHWSVNSSLLKDPVSYLWLRAWVVLRCWREWSLWIAKFLATHFIEFRISHFRKIQMSVPDFLFRHEK